MKRPFLGADEAHRLGGVAVAVYKKKGKSQGAAGLKHAGSFRPSPEIGYISGNQKHIGGFRLMPQTAYPIGFAVKIT
jgi:hypothetical protein